MRELALELRKQRSATGRTYAELAGESLLSPATLKRAASGASVPRFETVQAFYAACRPHLRREQQIAAWASILKKWRLARMEERGTLAAQTVNVDFVVDYRDFVLALRAFWERKGALPLRTVQRFSEDSILLPVSSLARILNRGAIPNERQLQAIIRGCLGTTLEQKKWEAAWDKVFRRQNARMVGHLDGAFSVKRSR
ncbi:helix-turn-helix domain-containing protein [Streptomyces sp. NPDC003273]|uniref:helix-turn-helix domain-containing protein n=1 Tax=Streptomyces sp. NPDC003273 TaxID=3364678 RepID=UPI0036A162F5